MYLTEHELKKLFRQIEDPFASKMRLAQAYASLLNANEAEKQTEVLKEILSLLKRIDERLKLK